MSRAPFVPPDSRDLCGRLAWLYYAEERRKITEGERRDIVWLERRIFGTSREDEARAQRPAAKGGE